MSTQSMVRQGKNAQLPTLTTRIFSALLAGFGLFVLAVMAFLAVFQLRYLGKVYPGVSIAGVDLSGVRRTEAATLLASSITYPTTGRIAFTYEGQAWSFTPAEVGLTFDAEATAEAAYRVGRGGWPWQRLAAQWSIWRGGVDVPPQMVFNGPLAQSALDGVAAQVNQSVVEASLEVRGLDVVVQPGQVGRTLDTWAATVALSQQLGTLQDGQIPLSVTESAPVILDASQQAEIARTILSQPLTLVAPANGPFPQETWTLEPQTLAEMLTITRVTIDDQPRYQVELDPGQLAAFLLGIAPELTLAPQNARFIFNDDTLQLDLLEPATIGRALEIQASVEAINQEILSGAHTVSLAFDYEDPAVTSEATAESLGITELVSAETTYFYGSSPERVNNIKVASSQFHGLLVAPGEVFSMVEHLGDVSLDSGYAESLIIYGDRTIQGVGGGVCQVSTTLFRTVFFGGFPVEERWSHAYRVKYYEQNPSGSTNERLAGLDATVYAPVVDFKFVNDTPYWLLMETYATNTSLTWKFYSTSDGRSVEWETTGLQNVVDPPKPVYEETDELEAGEIKQVDWAVEGADVTITRTVTRGGEIYFTDTFRTHYQAWATVCQYGIGTQGYPPKEKEQDPWSCTRKKQPSGVLYFKVEDGKLQL